MKRIVRRKRGFTLFEVLMVIVILGVLAAVIVPQFVGVGEDAKKRLAKTQVTSGLASPLDLYKLAIGRYPRTEEGLKALVVKPSDEDAAAKWAGPYLKVENEVRDPWGNELVYTCPGQYNQDGYDLSSPGPNGVPGDDDDITNWKRG